MLLTSPGILHFAVNVSVLILSVHRWNLLPMIGECVAFPLGNCSVCYCIIFLLKITGICFCFTHSFTALYYLPVSEENVFSIHFFSYLEELLRRNCFLWRFRHENRARNKPGLTGLLHPASPSCMSLLDYHFKVYDRAVPALCYLLLANNPPIYSFSALFQFDIGWQFRSGKLKKFPFYLLISEVLFFWVFIKFTILVICTCADQ